MPKTSNWALLLGTLLAAAGLLAATASARPADAAPSPEPVQLKQRTLDAFEHYMRLTEARNDEELRRGTPFLWVDGLPEAQRKAAYAELRAGQVKMERLETREAGRLIACPDGLIHHWVGVVFIPGATLPQTLRLLQDYDNHAVYYKPDVQRSKILERQDNDFKIFLRFRRKKIITVVLNTEHEVHYFPMDATHAHSRSRTTRIAEVENHDKPNEREKPVGDDGGYLWRMNTYWRFLEQDGGTYVQCEAISLTRDIPAGLGWLIGPFVTSIPRETLTATLNATRAALRRNSASAAQRQRGCRGVLSAAVDRPCGTVLGSTPTQPIALRSRIRAWTRSARAGESTPSTPRWRPPRLPPRRRTDETLARPLLRTLAAQLLPARCAADHRVKEIVLRWSLQRSEVWGPCPGPATASKGSPPLSKSGCRAGVSCVLRAQLHLI